jgi:repressor of nif and glnA expression
MSEKAVKKKLAILRILQKASRPVSSAQITTQLKGVGYDVSERTVRFHLLSLDKEGLTKNHGRRGREITELGRAELIHARVAEKVGYLAAKIDQMTYKMTFDLASRTGTVVVNMSVVSRKELATAAALVYRVFDKGYAMGNRLALAGPGRQMGDIVVPEEGVGICTVCSVTLNGVLLANGIPTYSRFGGLIELQDAIPPRFVEIIHYTGTTIDPLEVFIRSRMTDYTGATTDGNGRIGASFREMPAASRERVIAISESLKRVGLGGFMEIGWPGQPIFEVPVNEGQIGVVLIGGLNPAAILEEQNIKTHSRALSGLIQYEELFHYERLGDEIARYR